MSTERFNRLSSCTCWYQAAHVRVLIRALQRFSSLGFSVGKLQDELARCPKPWPEKVQRRVKRGFQKLVSIKILKHGKPSAELRVRQKLERWHLDGPAAHVARRVLRRIVRLRTLVAPRVPAAVFSLLRKSLVYRATFSAAPHVLQHVCSRMRWRS